MEKRQIGLTGLMVTELCFGTSPLGSAPATYGYKVEEGHARATIHAIFESGVNFMDASRNYGAGRSEQRIGAVIRERGGLPDGFVLSTKLDRDAETGRFDAERARRSIEESLKSLGLDRVQMLHLHDPEYARDLDEVTRTGGALDELFRMKEEGLARAVGLAMGRLDIMLPILRERPFDVLISHNRFTLLNRSADAMFSEAHERGITILNAAPYAGGVLAKGSVAMPRITYQEAEEAALAPVLRIEQICRAHGISPGAAALRFSVADPRITSTIVGISKPERVAQTLEWMAERIPEDIMSALRGIPFDTADPERNRRVD